MGTNFKSLRVRSVLEGLLKARPAPKFFCRDNDPEFIARSLAAFLSQKKIDSYFIEPGAPCQNGHAESFVSRLRDDILDVEVFHNLAEAQVKLAVYRRYYNEQRPHSSLGYRTPASFAAQFLGSVRNYATAAYSSTYAESNVASTCRAHDGAD